MGGLLKKLAGMGGFGLAGLAASGKAKSLAKSGVFGLTGLALAGNKKTPGADIPPEKISKKEQKSRDEMASMQGAFPNAQLVASDGQELTRTELARLRGKRMKRIRAGQSR